jgi:hypothetical protein
MITLYIHVIMYVCICIYIHMHMYIYIYIYTYIYIYVCMYVYTCIHTYMFISTCTYEFVHKVRFECSSGRNDYMYKYTCASFRTACTHACVNVRFMTLHRHVYMCVYVHVSMYECVYACMHKAPFDACILMHVS